MIHTFKVLKISYLCSRSSCSKNDRIVGISSLFTILYGVKSLVSKALSLMPDSSFSLKIIFINTFIRSGSGAVDCPKHKLDTTSIKNWRQLLLMLSMVLWLNLDFNSASIRFKCFFTFSRVLTCRKSGLLFKYCARKKQMFWYI